MKIAVIGVGGVGGYFGGLLARSGAEVTFVARGEHRAALLATGLSLATVEGSYQISPVSVVDAVAKLSEPDIILLCTKTYDLETVATEIARIATAKTAIIPLLNGIDNDLRIQEIIPHAKVYAGLCYIISARTAPGRVEQTAGPRTIFFGERGQEPDHRLRTLESMMKSAGILATASQQIEKELWSKYVWITAFAGMTALCRSSIGPIVNDPECFNLYIRCLDEAIAVAHASGIRFSDSERAKMIQRCEDYRLTGTHAKSSLLVDIESHRRTEIESLNGTLVRIAAQHGVAVPIHETIYQGIKLGCQNSQ